ncbi:unnamed protein product [Cuscuta campestris]|uniref:F-box domain-containing protein n=1 Tax=Cuscuta campestris TaxID=132261 RepID=A0A484KR04_9ASTE|nr:unnamed protein product [Cuscuta campestris]
MKLRLRSAVTKETIRVDVPSSSTLPELKRLLSQALPGSSADSSHFSPDYIRLSLNHRDELRCSSPDETLQMLGITSGDLIFFSLNPNPRESLETLNSSISCSNLPVESSTKPDPASQNEKSSESSSDFLIESTENSDSINQNQKNLEPSSIFQVESAKKSEYVNTTGLLHPGEEVEGELMEIDWDVNDDDDQLSVTPGKSFSIPGFLRKVFTEELSNDDGGVRDHKLLMIAVHGVLLESGFVGFDPILLKKIIRFQSPFQRGGTDPCYTLLEIADNVTVNDQNSNNIIPTFNLKIQTLGKFVIVYGFLSSGTSLVHHVELNEEHLVPLLNVAWSNCGLSEKIIPEEDGLIWTSPEKEIFQFWRTVKDRLALPLLIDICEVAGFGLPPCFVRLPTELKLKILELLPGVDLAKMSCVSSELNYLVSNDDLWKQKYLCEFGNPSDVRRRLAGKLVEFDFGSSAEDGGWKKKFSSALKKLKSRRRTVMFRRRPFGYMIPPFVGPWQPRIIGDHNPMLQPLLDHPHHIDTSIPRRLGSHVPHCDLR